MLRLIGNLSLTTQRPTQPGDNFLVVNSSDAVKLNALGVGDHTYLALRDGRAYEVVRYTHAAPITAVTGTVNVPVDRAQHGTTRRAWPIRTCTNNSYTEDVLREFVCQMKGTC